MTRPSVQWKCLSLLTAMVLICGCDWSKSFRGTRRVITNTIDVSPFPDGSDPVSLRPQIVQVERVAAANGIKTVYMGNRLGTFTLVCDEGQAQAITPSPGGFYFLFGESSRWRFPRDNSYITTKGFQDWVGKYSNHDNVVLVAVEQNTNGQWVRTQDGQWGLYWQQSWESNATTNPQKAP